MSFVQRYNQDSSKPPFGMWLKDLLLRAIAPAVVLFAVILGFGFLLKGPLKPLSTSEESVSKYIADRRTPTWNNITDYWSHIGNTEYVIAVAIVMALIIWALTKQWWFAVIPLIAISLQASVFVAATEITGRARPTVPHLDPAPPTSSYPSGHEGATTALYVSLALVAISRVHNRITRTILVIVCLAMPFLVGYARVYRGMHHVTDVSVGALNGLICALLAWGYLRRRQAGARAAADD